MTVELVDAPEGSARRKLIKSVKGEISLLSSRRRAADRLGSNLCREAPHHQPRDAIVREPEENPLHTVKGRRLGSQSSRL